MKTVLPRPLPCVFALLICVLGSALGDTSEYLSDCTERLMQTRQDWGTLGYDVAAHAPDRAGLPLQIAEQRFDKGLGHHANGAITVLLDNEFDRFETQIGVQPCAGGSVVFRVLVDGALRFESGIRKSGDAPLPVSVPVGGAQELVLEARDAGDGISCDMANWAEARLSRTGPSQPRSAVPVLDIAPFGRVATWDPQRLTGTRASRLEEFPAEDLFLETDLVPDDQDTFRVPIGTGNLACIGLQWLNRRAIRELRLDFIDPAARPLIPQVRVEGWFGESAWQGEWKPLSGEFTAEGNGMIFHAAAKAPTGGPLLTRKVRWVWTVPSPQARVRHPVAYTRTRWATATIRIEVGPGQPAEAREIHLENGSWGDAPSEFVRDIRLRLVPGHRVRPGTSTILPVRYAAPSAIKSDPTLLHVCVNGLAVAVAIEDVLGGEPVYLDKMGMLVCRADRPVTLAEYKRRIAGRKTVREEVRALPDQTLEQAMARTHHAAQNEGPVLLSLAADNTKFILERDGTLRFSDLPATRTEWPESTGLLRPDFGPGRAGPLTRRLEGGWLPVPVITVAQTNLVWRQRTFVAPVTDEAFDPADPYRPRPSVCVVEFEVTNTTADPAEASLHLSILTSTPGPRPAALTACAGGYLILRDQTPIGQALTDGARPLDTTVREGALEVRGILPARSSASWVVLLPADPRDVLKLPHCSQLRAQTERYWHGMLATATQIETPDEFLNNLVRSSQVRCLIAARNEAEGTRIAPWIAAISYGPLESESHAVIRGMDFLGHTEFAQRGLDYFAHRYNTNGFLTTGYTTFGTAWHLWTLTEHGQLHPETAWLNPIAPELKRVGRWILRQTQKTRKLEPDGHAKPEFGLMPPGVMADWNAYAYHFCLNAYYAAALRGLGNVLTEAGDPEGRTFAEGGCLLAAQTHAAFCQWRARAPAVPLRNGTWVPYYPSQPFSPGKLGDFFPGEDGNRSWAYDVELGSHQLVPTAVLDAQAHSDEVEPMLDHMEDVQFLESGWFDYPAEQNRQDWFNLGGFSKVQPYYTRNGEIYALCDDVKPFIRSYFNTLAAMVNPEVLTMWEHFNHSGAWDKTHETGHFLHQTRTMLVTERGDDLWLAPMITSNWLKHGRVVRVANAPTRFGPVGFRLESQVQNRHIDAIIDPPNREAPASIVLRVRHPEGKRIRSVTLNGRKHRDFSRELETVSVPSGPGPLRIEVRY